MSAAGPQPRASARPTARGVGLAAAGVAAFVAARGFGTPALAPVGIGLILAAVGAWLLVAAAARGLGATRTLDAGTPAAGDPVNAEIRVRGPVAGRLAARALDGDVDAGMDALGAARAVRVADGADRLVGVRRVVVASARRGEHLLPPVSVRLGDPFGLASARRAFGPAQRVLVVPATVPATADASLLGDRRRARRAPLGEDIAHVDGLREYRAGDPLSRVHWGQSAKRGRLHTKVFRADDGAGREATVLLALPAGAADADAELAVSAAASVCRAAAAGRDRGVSLMLGADAVPRECDGAEAMVRLARVRAGGGPAAGEMLRRAVRLLPPGAGVVVCTPLGDDDLADAAVAARRAGLEAVVVLTGAAAASAGALSARGVPVVAAGDAAALAAGLAPPARTRDARRRVRV